MTTFLISDHMTYDNMYSDVLGVYIEHIMGLLDNRVIYFVFL